MGSEKRPARDLAKYKQIVLIVNCTDYLSNITNKVSLVVFRVSPDRLQEPYSFCLCI